MKCSIYITSLSEPTVSMITHWQLSCSIEFIGLLPSIYNFKSVDLHTDSLVEASSTHSF
jgi:hypothetical protein